MKLTTNINPPSMAGLGPAAWEQDTHKVTMHPPLPGHVEYVEEQLHRHAHQHHVVHRDNPANHHVVISMRDLPPECLKRLLTGK